VTARSTIAESPAGVQRARIDDQNPWPGLGAFDEAAQRFFNGRREESAELRRLVLSAPLTVVFGASGLGKTSLLHAGLFPLIRRENLLPVYVRLDVRDGTAPLMAQATAALVAQFQAHGVDAPAFHGGETLWEWLHRDGLEIWSDRNQLLTPLLVLDQFEEVFTLGLENREGVQRLRIDLADLIENRIPAPLAGKIRQASELDSELSLGSHKYKVLISFREDFLPAVEGWKRDVPSVMRNRLRLLHMSGEQAYDAVHRTAPHLADEAISREIVRFAAAAQERSTTAIAGGDEASGDLAVEPALLSLVCHGLNERRKAQGKPAFDLALLRGTGQAIISDYYRDAVGDLPVRVQRFIEEELITERGFRKPCDIDDARAVHGIEDREVRLLVDRRLLRLEPHHGTERIELTHDLLTRVVREHRDAQRERDRSRRQNRRRIFVLAIGAGLVLLAVVLFAMYWKARSAKIAAELAQSLAKSAEARAQTALVAADIGEAVAALDNDRSDLALAHLARALRLSSQSDSLPARIWLSDLLLRRRWWVPITGALPHNDVVRLAAFSRDGARVVTASADGKARIWDAAGAGLLHEIAHQSPLRSAAFSPDGKRIVTAADDGFARIWDWSTGKLVGEPMALQSITGARFSPVGTRVITESSVVVENSVHTEFVWDAATGKRLGRGLQAKGLWMDSYNVVTPDGRFAASGSGVQVYLFKPDDGLPVGEMQHDRGYVTYIGFSPDGKRAVTVGYLQLPETAIADFSDIRMWNVPSGEPAGPPLNYEGTIRTAILNRDGSRLFTVSQENSTLLWDVKSGLRTSSHMRHRDRLNSAAFSPDNRVVLTTSDDGTARLWDAVSGEPAFESIRHGAAVRYAEFSPDGKYIVTASDDRTARVWQPVAYAKKELAPQNHREPLPPEISPDRRRRLEAAGNTLQVRDLSSGKTLGAPIQHQYRVGYVSFSADGRFALSASDDTPMPQGSSGIPPQPPGQSVRVWDLSTGKMVGQPMRHPLPVKSAAFSHDGTRIVTASAGVAQLWEVATGKPIGERMKHGTEIASCSFSDDGSRLATVSPSTMRIWDARSGKPLSGDIPAGAEIQHAAFAPDGNSLIVTMKNSPAKLVRLLIGSPKDSELLADLAEALCGCTIEQDATIPLPDQLERLRTLRQRAGNENQADDVRTFLREFFN
jgi:WD40 repeat protein